MTPLAPDKIEHKNDVTSENRHAAGHRRKTNEVATWETNPLIAAALVHEGLIQLQSTPNNVIHPGTAQMHTIPLCEFIKAPRWVRKVAQANTVRPPLTTTLVADRGGSIGWVRENHSIFWSCKLSQCGQYDKDHMFVADGGNVQPGSIKGTIKGTPSNATTRLWGGVHFPICISPADGTPLPELICLECNEATSLKGAPQCWKCNEQFKIMVPAEYEDEVRHGGQWIDRLERYRSMNIVKADQGVIVARSTGHYDKKQAEMLNETGTDRDAITTVEIIYLQDHDFAHDISIPTVVTQEVYNQWDADHPERENWQYVDRISGRTLAEVHELCENYNDCRAWHPRYMASITIKRWFEASVDGRRRIRGKAKTYGEILDIKEALEFNSGENVTLGEAAQHLTKKQRKAANGGQHSGPWALDSMKTQTRIMGRLRKQIKDWRPDIILKRKPKDEANIGDGFLEEVIDGVVYTLEPEFEEARTFLTDEECSYNTEVDSTHTIGSYYDGQSLVRQRISLKSHDKTWFKDAKICAHAYMFGLNYNAPYSQQPRITLTPTDCQLLALAVLCNYQIGSVGERMEMRQKRIHRAHAEVGMQIDAVALLEIICGDPYNVDMTVLVSNAADDKDESDAESRQMFTRVLEGDTTENQALPPLTIEELKTMTFRTVDGQRELIDYLNIDGQNHHREIVTTSALKEIVSGTQTTLVNLLRLTLRGWNVDALSADEVDQIDIARCQLD